MKRLLPFASLALALLLCPAPLPAAEQAPAAVAADSVKEQQWRGYRRVTFTFMGRAAWVTFPKAAAPGNPWMWRARFPGYHDEIDLGLLQRGYHTVHVDTANMYGSPKAMEIWDALYRHVTQTYGLNPRTVLYGCSRGGLIRPRPSV